MVNGVGARRLAIAPREPYRSRMNVRLGLPVLLACAAGCGRVADVPPDAGSPTSDYVMDFSQLPNHGLHAGNMKTVLFSLNLEERVHVYDQPPLLGDFVPVPPNVFSGYVLGADCDPGGLAGISNELHSHEIPAPVDSAWVDHLDVEMIPDGIAIPADGSDPRPAGLRNDRVCFGYRTTTLGDWQWDLTPQAITWNPGEGTYRMRLMVQRGAIDGMEIVFSIGNLFTVRKVVVATIPDRP